MRPTEKLFILAVVVALTLVLFLSTPAFVQRAKRARAQDEANRPKSAHVQLSKQTLVLISNRRVD